MKTKFVNRLIAVMITAVTTMMYCISPQNLRFNAILHEKAGIQAYAEDANWKNLYKEALNQLVTDGWTMEDNSSFNGSRFDLYELNGDDIPELFVTHDNANHAEGIIFSVVNGQLTKSSVGVHYGSIMVNSTEHMVYYNDNTSYLPSPNYYRFSEGVLYDITDSGENFGNITFESTGFKYSFDESVIEEVFSSDVGSNENAIKWQNAYADILKEYISSDVIKTAKFSLCYVDDNDIPELIVHSDGGAYHADTEVYLYTFYNGEIKNLGQISNDGYSNFTYYEKKGVVISGWMNQGLDIRGIHKLSAGEISSEHSYFSNEAAVESGGYSEFDDIRSDDAFEKYQACLPNTDPIHDTGEHSLTEENINLYLSDNSGNNSNVELSDIIDTNVTYYADWFEGDSMAIARYISTLTFENNTFTINEKPTISLPSVYQFEIGEMIEENTFSIVSIKMQSANSLYENGKGTLKVIDGNTIKIDFTYDYSGSSDSYSNIFTNVDATTTTTTTAATQTTTQTTTSSTTGITTKESDDNIEYQQKFIDRALDYIDSDDYNSLVRDGFYYDAVLSNRPNLFYTFERAKNLLSNDTTRTLIDTFDKVNILFGDDATKNTGYDYLFNQMMLNDNTYKGFQDTFELNVFIKTLDLFKEIAENGSDFLKKYGISISDINKAIKNFEEALDSGDNNKIETSMSELFDIIPKNADSESVKNLFKTISYDVGNTLETISDEIDIVLNQIDVATDLFDYIIYAEAYKNTCKEFEEVLLTVADYIDRGLYKGDIATQKELEILSGSIRKYVAGMKSYSESSYSSIALKAIELEIDPLCKYLFDEYLKDKYVDISRKVLHLSSNAFLAFKVGYKCLDIALEQELSMEQMKKSGEIIHGYEVISSVLYGAITDNKFESSVQNSFVVNPSYKNALLFNEAIKMKKNAQLLAMDSAIDYYVSLTKKEMNAVNRNDSIRYANSMTIDALTIEKGIFGNISIPENYKTLSEMIQQHFNDLNAAIIMCPVNVTIKLSDGSTAAFLSDEIVNTTDMYRYICDTYGTDRDIKVVFFAEDDEVLISGEDEGEMNIVIIGTSDKYYEFSDIPVTESMKVHISEINDDRAILDYTSDTLNTTFIDEAFIPEDTTTTTTSATTTTTTTTTAEQTTTVTTTSSNDYVEVNKDNITYHVYDNYATVYKCDSNAEGEVIIDEEINGVPVTKIEDWAFEYCQNITLINIPLSITYISECAFYFCSSLTSIDISENVNYLSPWAFFFCYSLESINVSENNSVYMDIDGILFTKDKTIIMVYPAGKTDTEYIIPDSVTTIGATFHSCINLETVTIPDSVEKIANYAFFNCTGLKTIIVPAGVERIYEHAFGACKNLESIRIENPDCDIYDKKCIWSKNENSVYSFSGTIYGYENSTAQSFSKSNGYNFVSVGDNISDKNNLGDINGDKMIDAVDASLILQEYALISTGNDFTFTDNQKSVADINNDSLIDAVDASLILQYYAYVSTGDIDSSDKYFSENI